MSAVVFVLFLAFALRKHMHLMMLCKELTKPWSNPISERKKREKETPKRTTKLFVYAQVQRILDIQAQGLLGLIVWPLQKVAGVYHWGRCSLGHYSHKPHKVWGKTCTTLDIQPEFIFMTVCSGYRRKIFMWMQMCPDTLTWEPSLSATNFSSNHVAPRPHRKMPRLQIIPGLKDFKIFSYTCSQCFQPSWILCHLDCGYSVILFTYLVTHYFCPSWF